MYKGKISARGCAARIAEISGRHSIFHEGGKVWRKRTTPIGRDPITFNEISLSLEGFMPSPVHLRKNNDPWIPFPAFRMRETPTIFPQPSARKRGGTPTYVSLPEYYLFDRFDQILIVRSLTSTNHEEWKICSIFRVVADVGRPIIANGAAICIQSGVVRRRIVSRVSNTSFLCRRTPTTLRPTNLRI